MATSESMQALRQALDRMDAGAVPARTPDIGYVRSAVARLQTKATKSSVAVPLGGSDEAVRVITHEEWSLANQAHLSNQERQNEIEDMSHRLDEVASRENELLAEIQRLQGQLEAGPEEDEDVVRLELLEIRRAGTEPEDELIEFEADLEPQLGEWNDSADWETGDDWSTADAEPAADAATEPPEPPGSAPPSLAHPDAPLEAEEVEDGTPLVQEEIHQMEAEIRKIEEELALIAAQERDLESRGIKRPKKDD